MHIVLTMLHIFVCILLILVVLLQAGKGANMGAAFGGSSSTVFGSSGAGSFLGKMTTMIAVAFMLTSLTLSYFSASTGSSVMDNVAQPARKAAPATAESKPLAPAGAGKTDTALPGVPAPAK